MEINKGERKKLPPLKIGNLEIRVPIIQGGMGIGVSLSGLATAVANCGGVGIISTANIGFAENDYSKNPLEANIRALKKNIVDALEKSKGAGGAIGVNIMCALSNYETYVKASIDAGAQMIISGAGLPMGLPGICQGTKAKLIPIVSSARATGLIFKTWAKRYDRLPDAVVFEGPEAGGHLGFKNDEIDSAQDHFFDTIKEIRSEIDNHDKAIPLIVAGGIYTREDIDKVMEIGANAVQMSTRFVTTEECDADIKFKQAYIDAKKEDIVIVKSPVGMPGRAIKNKFVERTMEGRIPPTSCNDCIVTCNPGTTPYCITQALVNAAKGDIDEGLIFCGANAYREDRIRTVKEVMDELTQ